MSRRRAVSKDQQYLIEAAKKKGWTIKEGGSHVRLLSPDGQQIILSRGKARETGPHDRSNRIADAKRKGLID